MQKVSIRLPRVLVLLVLLWLPASVHAQTPAVQAALGGWPGIGLQAGYVKTRSIYTLEVISYVDVLPWRDGYPFYISTGVGASLRPLGILREIGRANYEYDLDLGVRFGPGLFFTHDATRAEKNRQFSLFLDPFLRFTLRKMSPSNYFIEIGPQRPIFRLGLWISIR